MSAIDSVPPHNLEAERGLLGALLTDPRTSRELSADLEPADFYRDTHAEVCRAIQALHGRDEPADLLTVTEELTRRSTIATVGGATAVVGLTAALPSVAHAASYAAIVRDLAARRRLIHTAHDIIEEAFTSAQAAAEIIARAEAAVAAVAPVSATSRVLPAYSFEELGNLPPMEFLIDGLIPEHGFVELVAPYSGFKTWFAIAETDAVTSGTPFLGLPTRIGKVCYLLAESAATAFYSRLSALKCDNRGHGLEENLLVIPAAPQLATRAGREELYRTLDAYDFDPDLLIADTRRRISVGLEENSSTAMGLLEAGLDEIRSERGMAIQTIHHTGRQGGLGRGSNVIESGADAVLAIDGDPSLGARLKFAKACRYAAESESPLRFHFRACGPGLVIEHGFHVDAKAENVTPAQVAVVRALASGPLRYTPLLTASGLAKGTLSKITSAEDLVAKNRDGEWELTPQGTFVLEGSGFRGTGIPPELNLHAGSARTSLNLSRTSEPAREGID